MKSHWSPLSALIFTHPRMYATPLLLRRMIDSDRSVELIYAGDRMWPTVSHGQVISVLPLPREFPKVGTVVVACPGGIPDLLRIDSRRGEFLILRGDSDPMNLFRLKSGEVLGQVSLPPRRVGRVGRAFRRLCIDLREALGEAPQAGGDAAETVRLKYQTQAPFYAEVRGADLEEYAVSRVKPHVKPRGRIVVAGSGSGREAFALARAGWTVLGIDFAPAMIELARREARRRQIEVDFQVADLRSHEEAPGSLLAVFLTYDVFSFIPEHGVRASLLRKMARWVGPHGVIFLSARRLRGFYDWLILSLQWLASVRARERVWGHSHTRWIAPDGELRRAFVQVFSKGRLRQEVKQAGLIMGAWEGGHIVLRAPGSPSVP